AHAGHCLVDNREHCSVARSVERFHKLEVANRRLVQHQVIGWLKIREPGDVGSFLLLCLANVVKDAARGGDCKLPTREAKPIKRCNAEVCHQKLASAFEGEEPLVERVERGLISGEAQGAWTRVALGRDRPALALGFAPGPEQRLKRFWKDYFPMAEAIELFQHSLPCR